MVLTGTGPGRGKHGKDEHLKEDVAAAARAQTRGEIWNLTFFFFGHACSLYVHLWPSAWTWQLRCIGV